MRADSPDCGSTHPLSTYAFISFMLLMSPLTLLPTCPAARRTVYCSPLLLLGVLSLGTPRSGRDCTARASRSWRRIEWTLKGTGGGRKWTYESTASKHTTLESGLTLWSAPFTLGNRSSDPQGPTGKFLCVVLTFVWHCSSCRSS